MLKISREIIERKLRESHFLDGVLKLASGAAIAQLILVFATPVLSRFYSPEDFGLFSVFVAIHGIVGVASCLRYELSIPLPRSDRNARQLLVFALQINCAFTVAVFFIINLLSPEILVRFKVSALADYLWMIPVGVLFVGFYMSFLYWAIRAKRFRSIASTKISKSVSSVCVQVVAGFMSLGFLGLIVGHLLGQAVGILRLAMGTGILKKSHFSRLAILRSRILARKYIRFPLYDVPASAVDTMSAQLPQVLLAFLFNPIVAGFYILADRVLAIPIGLVGQAVGQVFYADSKRALANGNLAKLTKQIALNLFMMISLPMIIIISFAGELFPFVFGEIWRESGIYAGWMILGLSMQFVYSPISMVLMATDGQKVNLTIHTLMLLSKLLVIVCAFNLDNPLAAVAGISLVNMFGYMLASMVVFLRAKKYDYIYTTGKSREL